MTALIAFAAIAVSPAAAQSSLDEVKCSFFDEYVDSNFQRDAAMPLAIAVAGDELPAEVSSAFSAIEDGRLIQPSQNDAIVAYFGPLCHTPASSEAAVLTAPIAGRVDPAATPNAAAPDELASTGVNDMTLLFALIGIVLVMLGFMVPNLYHPRSVFTAQPSHSGIPGAGDQQVHSPAPKTSRHQFWLLDESAS